MSLKFSSSHSRPLDICKPANQNLVMRIIAGELRGRKLVPPEGRQTTRPITDKVKETLFNKLASSGILPASPHDLEPSGQSAARVVDVFSGTGSLGIEALSRGAAFCTFIELSRQARRGLKQNLAELGLTERARIIEGDGLIGTWLHGVRDGSIRALFLDPPYALMRDDRGRAQLNQLIARAATKLEPGGVITLRGPAEADAAPVRAERLESGTNSAGPPPLEGPVTDRFKHMAIHYYQKPPTAGDS